MIHRGDLVARSVDSVQHLARVVMSDGTVACLCGTSMRGARRHGNRGPVCGACIRLREEGRQ